MLWTTSGTACWGLAPSLFCTPIVSSDSAGFALLNFKFQRLQDTMEADKTFDLALEKLNRLFRGGKASARDVDRMETLYCT